MDQAGSFGLSASGFGASPSVGGRRKPPSPPGAPPSGRRKPSTLARLTGLPRLASTTAHHLAHFFGGLDVLFFRDAAIGVGVHALEHFLGITKHAGTPAFGSARAARTGRAFRRTAWTISFRTSPSGLVAPSAPGGRRKPPSPPPGGPPSGRRIPWPCPSAPRRIICEILPISS
jgi:hypothetical protein